MANLGSIAALQADVDANVDTNGANAITGATLNSVLTNTIDTLTGTPVGSGKVYEAALTQTGTGAPVAVVFQNTTGRTVTWTREDVGTYIGRFNSSIDSENSGCSLGEVRSVDPTVNISDGSAEMSDTIISIRTWNLPADGATDVTIAYSDDILYRTLIRIIIP